MLHETFFLFFGKNLRQAVCCIFRRPKMCQHKTQYFPIFFSLLYAIQIIGVYDIQGYIGVYILYTLYNLGALLIIEGDFH